MGIARSTYYDEPASRRVTAELCATGCLVNHNKVMRLMREHGLTVRPRRRFVATADSDHDGPIFPNLAKDGLPTGPNQLTFELADDISILNSGVVVFTGPASEIKINDAIVVAQHLGVH